MEEVSQKSWNKKRIFAAIFLIAVLVIGLFLLKDRILNLKYSPNKSSEQVKKVKGVSLEDKSSDKNFNVQEAIQEKIKTIREQVSSLNIVEIASSSPQVQKIINDIKSLEDYPTNQVKEICRKVCGL